MKKNRFWYNLIVVIIFSTLAIITDSPEISMVWLLIELVLIVAIFGNILSNPSPNEKKVLDFLGI